MDSFTIHRCDIYEKRFLEIATKLGIEDTKDITSITVMPGAFITNCDMETYHSTLEPTPFTKEAEDCIARGGE